MASDERFSEAEKAELLKEIIKASSVPSHTLARFAFEHHIQPSWEDIPIPQGRTIRQCQFEFNDARPPQQFSQPPPDSRADPRQLHPPPPSQGFPPRPPFQPEGIVPAHRTIQPRPVPFTPDQPQSPYSPQSTDSKKRGRGRPKKEEAAAMEQQREAARLRGEPDPFPPSRKRRKKAPQEVTVKVPSSDPGPSRSEASTSTAVTPTVQNVPSDERRLPPLLNPAPPPRPSLLSPNPSPTVSGYPMGASGSGFTPVRQSPGNTGLPPVMTQEPSSSRSGYHPPPPGIVRNISGQQPPSAESPREPGPSCSQYSRGPPMPQNTAPMPPPLERPAEQNPSASNPPREPPASPSNPHSTRSSDPPAPRRDMER